MPRIAVTLITLGLCLSGAVSARAAPDLDWIYPSGGQRGTSFIAEIHGSEMEHLAGVLCAGPGVTAQVLPNPAKSGGEIPRFADPDTARAVRFTIAPDAPLGGCETRIWNSDGLSHSKIFMVGQWPETHEVELNRTPAMANPITLPVTVNARLQGGSDQDYFKFSAKAGQHIACEIHAERLVSTIGDAWVECTMEISDTTGKVLAHNEGRFHWGPELNFTVPANGDYFVRIHDLLWRGDPSAVYRLTIGAVPFVTAMFPLGGRRGSTVTAAFDGINLPAGAHQPVEIKADDPRDTCEIRLRTPEGLSNPMTFQLSDDPEVNETEPNHNATQADVVPVPVTVNGRLSQPGEHDFFRFHARAGQHLILELYSSRGGTPMDSVLELRDSRGKLLQQNDDARDRDSVIDQVFPAEDDYTVEVSDVDDRGGPEYVYRLNIAPPRPDFRLTVDPDRIDVPVSGAAAINVTLHAWWTFDSPVHLTIEGLPPGVHATVAPFELGLKRTIILLEGPPANPWTAPTPASSVSLISDGPRSIAGVRPSLITIVGSAMVDGREVRHAATCQESMLMEGNNEVLRTVVGPYAVVAESVPLALKTTASVYTLKPGSSVSIPVTIVRTLPIKVALTLGATGLPFGVSVEAVRIPETGDSGVLVLKAAATAAAGDIPIIISGAISRPNASDEVIVAPFVHLRVE